MRRLDFLITGSTPQSPYVSQIWRNTGNGFSNVTSAVAPLLPGVAAGGAVWGDYDGDGRLDILLHGDASSGSIAQIWRNTGSGFSNATAVANLPLVFYSSASWVDYDGDG